MPQDTILGKKDRVLAAVWMLQAVLAHYAAARGSLAHCDLTEVDLPAAPERLLSDQMVARTIPRAVPDTPAPLARPMPALAPKLLKTATRADIGQLVHDLAPGHGLDPVLVLAVIEVESDLNPRTQSPKRAQGLMQRIPTTANRFGVDDPWDPHQNLRGGMAYLHRLPGHFDGDLMLACPG